MMDPRTTASLFESSFANAPNGIAIVSLDGKWLKVNKALCAIVGYTESEMLELDFQRMTHPRDLQNDLSALAALQAGNISHFRTEKRYFHKSGAIVWIEISVSVIRRPDGKPDCFVCHISDISARKRAESERDAFFELTSDMAGVLLRNGRFGRVNHAFTATLGWTADEATARPFVEFVHPDDRAGTEAALNAVLAGEPHPPCVNRCRSRDGTYRWIEWHHSVAHGELIYYAGRDISAQKDTERQLHQIKDELDNVLSNVPAMIGFWDAELRNRFANKAYIEWFGKRPEELRGRHIKELLGPELFARNWPYMEKALQGETQVFERELVDARGNRRHTQAVYLPLLHAGKVEGFYAMVTDITPRKRAEEALAAEKERFATTLAHIGEAVLTTDATGIIDSLNPAACTLTGWAADAAVGRSVGEVIRLRDEQTDAPLDVLDVLDGPPEVQGEGGEPLLPTLLRQDASPVAVSVTVSRIESRPPVPDGYVVVLRDESEIRRRLSRATFDATHDALTGLLNRAEFERILRRTCAGSAENRLTHCLLLLDLDDFKAVNDTAGHLAGDGLLKWFTSRVTQHLRSRDCFARLGGDEFAILLHGCPAMEGYGKAAAMLDAVRTQPFEWKGLRFALGASIGVTTVGPAQHQYERVMEVADEACYRAKRAGKSQAFLIDAEAASPDGAPASAAGSASDR